jgi:hypothetical protein
VTAQEREELIGLLLAAMQVVVPRVSNDERSLVRVVLDGMLREHPAVLGYD